MFSADPRGGCSEVSVVAFGTPRCAMTLPLISQPTKSTIIGVFEGDGASDIFQVLSKDGSVAVHMNSTGSLDPPIYPQTAFVTITSAQLLAMNTTPVVLIPSPKPASGTANLYISPQYFSVVYQAGTIPYSGTTSGGTFFFGWGTTKSKIANTLAVEILDQNFVDQPASLLAITGADTSSTFAALSDIINKPFSMYLDTDTLTAGNGTLLVTIQYSVVQVS
jgi:hypothetical protein